MSGLGSVAEYTYGELLAALRVDLQLDATTDLLDGTVAQVIDDLDAAPFAQLTSPLKTRMVFGAWGAGNPPVLGAGGSGDWSVTWLATGHYLLTFPTPFVGGFYGLALSTTSQAVAAQVVAGTGAAGSAEVQTVDTTGTRVDATVRFLLVGCVA